MLPIFSRIVVWVRPITETDREITYMRMRKATGIAALVAVAATAVLGTALADKYSDLTAKATPLASSSDVAGLFWSTTVECAKGGNDLERRQCEGVKAARAQQAATGHYTVSGDALAFVVGDYDAKAGGVPITLYGCVACGQAADVAGQKRFLTVKGDVKAEGDVVRGPVLHKGLRKFKSEADAKKWKDAVAPRLRTQFAVTLPAKPVEWQAGAARGYAVELEGFRVYDPCDGAMICSDPPSENEKADRAACKGGLGSTELESPEAAAPKMIEKPAAPVDERPEQLSAYQVKKAMASAQAGVQACFAQYGVPGKADFAIEIGGDGKVRKVELRGPFKDTPTGACITTAVKNTEFPAFKAENMNINYPFILR
jgi:hypothetical protein